MTVELNDVNPLIELALDRSPQGRQILASRIGALCADEDQALSEQECDLISEILKKLLRSCELPVRQQLSEILAKSESCPGELVVLLANDQIEVARPLLLRSELLDDPDLIEIIRHRGQQHQLVIARRHGLSARVSDAPCGYRGSRCDPHTLGE